MMIDSYFQQAVNQLSHIYSDSFYLSSLDMRALIFCELFPNWLGIVLLVTVFLCYNPFLAPPIAPDCEISLGDDQKLHHQLLSAVESIGLVMISNIV